MINSKMELSIIVTFFSLVLLILVNKFVKDCVCPYGFGLSQIYRGRVILPDGLL